MMIYILKVYKTKQQANYYLIINIYHFIFLLLMCDTNSFYNVLICFCV
ncbi:hypothetical protein Pint_33900 [Pistacia integerrima]|uniref:Uncharacterized protein n=1 Tax=Pistacia integerrima TaxID=434235 RepID=A0ACC0X782_9ROSI|nr:hypothetical protein Pint_33900 [Pistacia integerrima]